MTAILNYRCDFISEDKFIPHGITIEKIIDLEKGLIYEHDVLIWNNNFLFGPQQLKLFPKLKFFINWGVDDKNIQTHKQFIKRGVTVKKVDYYCTETLSEYVLAIILSFERKLKLLLSDQKVKGNEIYGKSVGIIGLGKIGFRLAQIFKKSFNCQVYYYSRQNKLLDSFDYIDIKKIFQICDYVILTVKSRDLSINGKSLLSANKNLVIVNISNDSVLPLKTILPLIKSGKIRGYMGDLLNTNIEKRSLPENVILVNKYGYLTNEAKTIKDNILLTYLKKASYEGIPNNLYIIRHGQTEWNKSGVFQGSLDSSLTKEGIQNAQKIAHLLKNKQISVIFTSPLGRAKQTAKIISSKIKAKVIIIPDFREMNFGIFEGKKQKAVKNLFREFFAKRAKNKFYKLYEPYPEGENYFNVFLRIVKSLTGILPSYQNFVIIGHESVNRIIRGIIRELPLEEMIFLRQKNSELISINFHTLKETIVNID